MRKELKRWIAERFFERELDEDYFMGLRYGQDLNNKALVRRITDIRETATKKNQPGIDAILEVLK